MLQLDLSVDLDSATAFLSSISRRHIPFAAARALSAVAAESRDAVRLDMPHRFTVRRPWIIRGIDFERATKSSLEASVFSRDMFMADQEAGGSRDARRRPAPEPRPFLPWHIENCMAGIHATRVIPKSQLPAALKARTNVFYTESGVPTGREVSLSIAATALNRSISFASAHASPPGSACP